MRARLLGLALCLVTAAVSAQGVSTTGRSILQVRLDEANLMRLEQPVSTLIVGNPAVADAVVHDGLTLVVTGKSFGTTNIIALGRRGEVLLERQVHVSQPLSSILTVQRGEELETYACAPQCRRAPVIGDTQRGFSETLTQTQTRNALATSSIGAR